MPVGDTVGAAAVSGARPVLSLVVMAPARAPGGAGFKGQRPLRTVSPPFNLCLALIGLASIRNLLPRFGCTFVLAMISSVLSDFSVFFFYCGGCPPQAPTGNKLVKLQGKRRVAGDKKALAKLFKKPEAKMLLP